jgi:hypothetical protein
MDRGGNYLIIEADGEQKLGEGPASGEDRKVGGKISKLINK